MRPRATFSWLARETGRIDAIIVDRWAGDSSITDVQPQFSLISSFPYRATSNTVRLCIEDKLIMVFIDSAGWFGEIYCSNVPCCGSSRIVTNFKFNETRKWKIYRRRYTGWSISFGFLFNMPAAVCETTFFT